jgi:hypothetical protein
MAPLARSSPPNRESFSVLPFTEFHEKLVELYLYPTRKFESLLNRSNAGYIGGVISGSQNIDQHVELFLKCSNSCFKISKYSEKVLKVSNDEYCKLLKS